VAKKKAPVNPFYVLVVIVGVGFVLTASAYGMMSFLEIRRFAPGTPDTESSPLWTYLRTDGAKLLVWEIGMLIVGTLGALAWDSFLGRDEDEGPA
jgi:hypothetical protein